MLLLNHRLQFFHESAFLESLENFLNYPKLMDVARDSARLVANSSTEERRFPSVLSCSPSSKRSHLMVWQVPTVRPYLSLNHGLRGYQKVIQNKVTQPRLHLSIASCDITLLPY